MGLTTVCVSSRCAMFQITLIVLAELVVLARKELPSLSLRRTTRQSSTISNRSCSIAQCLCVLQNLPTIQKHSTSLAPSCKRNAKMKSYSTFKRYDCGKATLVHLQSSACFERTVCLAEVQLMNHGHGFKCLNYRSFRADVLTESNEFQWTEKSLNCTRQNDSTRGQVYGHFLATVEFDDYSRVLSTAATNFILLISTWKRER